MKLLVVTPASRGSRKGNRITALRWAALWRALGHRVVIAESWSGQPCDVLVALHATRSHPSIEAFHAARPRAPIVLALTGTDLYQDGLAAPAPSQRSLALATRAVVLQGSALEVVPPPFRDRVVAIVQSARPARPIPAPAGAFQICMLAHLRDVKDPFLGAAATRLLPSRSRLRLVHLGAAADDATGDRAERETGSNPRYRWLGERPRSEALGILAGSEALLVTSRSEGGANVVSEAVASGIPVLSTRIAGTVGVLGPDYGGYFTVGDAAGLAALLTRVEEEAPFRAELREAIEQVRPLVDPRRERAAWKALLDELAPTPPTGG